MMRRKAILLMLTAVFVLAGQGYSKVIINFDDLVSANGEPAPIPDGYKGLVWDSNWEFFNYDTVPGIEPFSFPNAIGIHRDGWNVLQADASVSFISVSPDPFEGGYLAGDDDVDVYFVGWLGSTLVGTSKTITLSAIPTLLEADFSGPIDKLIVHAERKYTSSTFIMDDITYTLEIPEPTTLLLLTLGILALRKRKS